MNFKERTLKYHSGFPRGKTQVIPTKPTIDANDLSMAYSPGVAYPCLEIQEKPELVYEYTNKGNLVGVITNGTAILGLGNIGPLAGKPVMEGKAVLFKKFAGIDVFDLEIAEPDPDKFIETVARLEPTFGGINLEDIKAPECFRIEKELDQRMKIPVFHDDQHGTAIISTAALWNCLALNGKKIQDLKVVMNGAGAAAISIAEMFMEIGVKREQIFLVDSQGVIHSERTNLHESKLAFAHKTKDRTLGDCFKDADVFVGVSVGNVVSQEMLQTMNTDPIVFALANPDPEISYELAIAARKDILFATGRSDYPNQVNNVLGFPFIFRGAIDTGAKQVNMQMKLACAKALSDLTRELVPTEILKAYGLEHLEFGPNYLIPKPLDRRVLYHVAPAVAQAAVDSGVASREFLGKEAYVQQLERLNIESL